LIRKLIIAAGTLLAICVLALAPMGSGQAQQAHYAKHGPALLPDPTITPGVVALTDTKTVCATGSTRDERHVSEAMKAASYAQYGAVKKAGVCCEVDHLISLELGGASDPKNLWPQPYSPKPGAHEKDWLENELHKEVCSGKITLADAQKEIAADWYAAYLKRKTTPATTPKP
jgi:hypothetical protein